MILLYLDDLIATCAIEGYKLHVSEFFIRHKEDDPAGRGIIDYSFSRFGTPLNDPILKDAYATTYGPINQPTLVSVCKCMLTAQMVFRDQPIIGARTDISRAYRRIPGSISDATYALLFTTVTTRERK